MTTNGSTSPVSTVQPLNDDQTNTLVTVSTESPATQDLADVVQVILNTGLRRSEACDLLWDHVDLNNLKITVPGGKCPSARFIPIVPEVLTVLLNLQCDPNSKYVFGERRKGLFRRVEHQLAILAPKIGVLHLGLHTLRHTFAARLANAGAPAFVIMVIGGWKSWGSLVRFFPVSEPVLKSEYDAAVKKEI
jgi:integrase/recombinase XerC